MSIHTSAALYGCTLLLSFAAIALTSPASAQRSSGSKMIVYIGGYTKGKTKGIFIYSMNPATGELKQEGVGPDVESPSYLALHPNHKFLYAVNEIDNFEGASAGAVTSYKIDQSTGALTLINQVTSGGAGPCHLSLDRDGKHVFVANYGGGSVEVIPVEENGSLGKPSCFVQHTGTGPDAARQEGPHAHSAVVDPTGKFVMVNDLGTDKVIVYRYNAGNGTIDSTGLAPGMAPPGSGPRHIAFLPDGKHAACINEMKSTITMFDYNSATGGLKEYQTISTLPDGFSGSSTCAEIAASPDGKFIYGSNRGADDLAIFAVSPRDHKLSLVGHQSTQGKVPRCFGIDPSGSFLIAANQETNTIVVFKRDKASGTLTPTGQSLDVPAPVCVVYLKLGK